MLTEETFNDKMNRLNPSQQAIETTSAWCCLWRAEAQKLVAWWENYFVAAPQDRRLTLIYLANDILQNSRKKGPEFVEAYFKVMPRALRAIYSKADQKTRHSIQKVVRVWGERQVFGHSGVKSMQQAIDEAGVSAPSTAKTDNQLQQPSSSSRLVAPCDAAPQLIKISKYLKQAQDAAALGESSRAEWRANAQNDPDAARQSMEKASSELGNAIDFNNKAISLLLELISQQNDAIMQLQAKKEEFERQQVDFPAVATGDQEEGRPADTNNEIPPELPDAASIAAQLVSNPGALLQALAALPQEQQAATLGQISAPVGKAGDADTSKQAAENGGDKNDADLDEYDPEDAFGDA